MHVRNIQAPTFSYCSAISGSHYLRLCSPETLSVSGVSWRNVLDWWEPAHFQSEMKCHFSTHTAIDKYPAWNEKSLVGYKPTGKAQVQFLTLTMALFHLVVLVPLCLHCIVHPHSLTWVTGTLKGLEPSLTLLVKSVLFLLWRWKYLLWNRSIGLVNTS